jgi:2-polyprenyl-6-hydroxyphenyl methylase/3-demethylubiquinone-9 3-methyltransferase
MSSNEWNEQYSTGVWDFLNDSREVAHYAVQAALVHHFSPSALILDVACGEGILQGYLKRWGYRGYLGIDTSQAAIEKANSRNDDCTLFMTADAEQFTPPHEFTSIVFSECLYYFADPGRVLRQYANWLTGGGIIVISVYASHDSEGLAIPTDSLTILEETTVLNARGAWKCTALSRKA